MRLRTVSPALILALAAGLAAAEPTANLLPNGDMEAGAEGGSPTGWKGAWSLDPSNRFLHLQAAAGQTVRAERILPVSGKALILGLRVRHQDLPAGGGARVEVDFLDAEGRVVLPGPAFPQFTGTSTGWQRCTVRCFVPAKAVSLRVAPTLAGVAAGSLDCDDFSLTAVHPADLAPELRTSGRVPVDAGLGAPAALRVDGRRLVDPAGAEVRLQGVALPPPDPRDPEALLPALATATGLWKANLVRLPLDPVAWSGPGQAAYRAAVERTVAAAASRKTWIALDLVRPRAPLAADAAFWSEVAGRFKDQPAVLFGLFRAPHDLSWAAWRGGGALGAQPAPIHPDTLAEDALPLAAGTTCGMQALVDAVRGAGARNLILVDGPDWGTDLSQLGDGLDDRGGSGVVYGVRLRPWVARWQGRFLDAAARLPVLVDAGCGLRGPAAIPAAKVEDPFTWGPDALAMIQRQGLSWSATGFDPAAESPLVVDLHAFVPTAWWGYLVRSGMAGAHLASERLR